MVIDGDKTVFTAKLEKEFDFSACHIHKQIHTRARPAKPNRLNRKMWFDKNDRPKKSRELKSYWILRLLITFAVVVVVVFLFFIIFLCAKQEKQDSYHINSKRYFTHKSSRSLSTLKILFEIDVPKLAYKSNNIYQKLPLITIFIVFHLNQTNRLQRRIKTHAFFFLLYFLVGKKFKFNRR